MTTPSRPSSAPADEPAATHGHPGEPCQPGHAPTGAPTSCWVAAKGQPHPWGHPYCMPSCLPDSEASPQAGESRG